jgi:hypothetical protein
MVQLFAMHFFGGIEILILTVMAYDRYVAICKPLHYTIIMSRQRCNAMATACCAGAFLHSSVQFLLTINLPFCGPNQINHYFCDVYPLLKLACTDTYRVGILVVANSGMMGLVTFVVLMLSYLLIFYTIRAYPAQSRSKALSTCSSHITVVVLLFVPVLFIYIRPATTLPEDKVFALFYTIIAPMFNPLIYTLRDMEMKKSLRKVWCQQPFLTGKQVIRNGQTFILITQGIRVELSSLLVYDSNCFPIINNHRNCCQFVNNAIFFEQPYSIFVDLQLLSVSFFNILSHDFLLWPQSQFVEYFPPFILVQSLLIRAHNYFFLLCSRHCIFILQI